MRPGKVVDYIPEISKHLPVISIDESELSGIENIHIQTYPMVISNRGRKASMDFENGQPVSSDGNLIGDYEQLRQLERTQGVFMSESDMDGIIGMSLKASLAALIRLGEKDLSHIKGKDRRKLGRAINNLTNTVTNMSLERVYIGHGLFLDHAPKKHIHENEEHYEQLLPFVSRGLRTFIKDRLRVQE